VGVYLVEYNAKEVSIIKIIGLKTGFLGIVAWGGQEHIGKEKSRC